MERLSILLLSVFMVIAGLLLGFCLIAMSVSIWQETLEEWGSFRSVENYAFLAFGTYIGIMAILVITGSIFASILITKSE